MSPGRGWLQSPRHERRLAGASVWLATAMLVGCAAGDLAQRPLPQGQTPARLRIRLEPGVIGIIGQVGTLGITSIFHNLYLDDTKVATLRLGNFDRTYDVQPGPHAVKVLAQGTMFFAVPIEGFKESPRDSVRVDLAPGQTKVMTWRQFTGWSVEDAPGEEGPREAQARAQDPAQLERATTLDVEARQLLRDGRYAEGLPKAREALSIRERALDPYDLDVAASLNTLGDLHQVQGKYADAEPLYKRALGIRERVWGDHPHVAQTLNSLAMLYNAQARYPDAETLLERALGILDGPAAARLPSRALHAEVLENLAKVYRALGKLREAEEAQARAAMLWTLR